MYGPRRFCDSASMRLTNGLTVLSVLASWGAYEAFQSAAKLGSPMIRLTDAFTAAAVELEVALPHLLST